MAVIEVGTVSGRLSRAGAILEGTGYSVLHLEVGRYAITFVVPFAEAPEVAVTAELDRLAKVDRVTASGFWIETTGGEGVTDAATSFVAETGQRRRRDSHSRVTGGVLTTVRRTRSGLRAPRP